MYCVLQLLKRHGHNFGDLFFNFHKHANGYKSLIYLFCSVLNKVHH